MRAFAEAATDREALGLMSAEELGAVADDAEDLAAHHRATADRYARQARLARMEQQSRAGRVR